MTDSENYNGSSASLSELLPFISAITDLNVGEKVLFENLKKRINVLNKYSVYSAKNKVYLISPHFSYLN